MDVYCARCGMRQSVASPSATSDPFSSISPRTASMLCYIPMMGWIASIVVLASPRFRLDRIVRFHAFQGLYLFVAWLIVDWVMLPFSRAMTGGHNPFGAVASLLHLAIFGAWIWMILKTAQEQTFHLPIIGELAERSLAEQR